MKSLRTTLDFCFPTLIFLPVWHGSIRLDLRYGKKLFICIFLFQLIVTLIENVRKPFHPSRWFNCVLIKWHKAAFCSMNYTNRTWPGQSEWFAPPPPSLNWNYLLPPHFFHHKSLNSSTIVSNEPHIYSFAVPLSLNVFAVAVKLRWQQPNIWKQPLILNHCVWEKMTSSHLHRDSGRGARRHMSWLRRRRASQSNLSRQFESEGFGWRSLKKNNLHSAAKMGSYPAELSVCVSPTTNYSAWAIAAVWHNER